MPNDLDQLPENRPRYETVYKKEANFSELLLNLIALIILALAFKYFLLDLGIFTYLIALLGTAVGILTIFRIWNEYSMRIIINENGIMEKYKSSKGGWSYQWSEISEWNAVIDEEGSREIRFTTTDYMPKTHTLSQAIIDERRFDDVKRLFLKYHGEPTKVNSWMLGNVPDNE